MDHPDQSNPRPTSPGSLPPKPFPSTPIRHSSPWWLWVLTIGLLGTVVFLQRPEPSDPAIGQKAAAGLGAIKPPKTDPMILLGKLLMAVREVSPLNTPQIVQIIDQFAGWLPDSPLGGTVSAKNPPKKSTKPTPAADRLRATILVGEALGPIELDWRLKDIQAGLDPTSTLVQDVQTVRTLYSVPDVDAKSETPVPLRDETLALVTPDARKGFTDRHGFFADLALTRGKLPADAPVRTAAATDGVLIIVLLVVMGGLILLAGIAGVVVLIIGGVMYFNGSLHARFRVPVASTEWPNGEAASNHGFAGISSSPERRYPNPETRSSSSVWLETVAVFLGGFLALKLAGIGVAAAFPKQDWTVWVSLVGQWLLLSAIFWPIVRGMSTQRWRGEIGWHSGQGVLKEMLCGVLGYLACLPVYFAMALIVVLISLAISAITGSDPVSPADNKVLDIVEGGSFFEMVVIFLLATVWAPIVEESIFRGALFRHLRRRVPLILAALGSCMVFAILHGYVIQGLFMVGTLGFWFALMREWRGSLIPSATAHAIHNGVVLTLIISMVYLASA